MELDCGVSHDRLATRVRVDRVLNAAELEELIWSLVACRADMEPRRLPVMFTGGRIVLGAGLHVQRREDGEVLLAVHHPGLGWVGSNAGATALTAAVAAGR
jgi:hypothetical protein